MSQIIIQKGTHDESSKSSTTNNRTNRSNKSDTTIGSNTKRKSDALFKAKNNRDKKMVRFGVKNTPSKKASNDATPSKNADNDVKIKQELIESEDKTQQSEIIGNDKESITIDLLENSSKPGTVNAVPGTT